MIGIVAFATGSFAQGTVVFANTAATTVKIANTPDEPPVNVGLTADSGAYVQLLWAPLGTTDLNLFLPVATQVTQYTTANGITDFHTVPGLFFGGVATVNVSTPGGGVALVLRGWTGGFDSYEAALGSQAAFVGYSIIWELASTGNPVGIPPTVPARLNAPAGGFVLHIVPEPTSMALAGLGAAALLIFRRRK